MTLIKKIFDDISSKRALVVGSGYMIKLAIKYLHANNIHDITLTNRNYEKGSKVAKENQCNYARLQYLPNIISSHDIKKYDQKMRLQEAKDSAYRLLSYRMRSEGEMRKRLKDKSFLKDEIDTTVSYLKKQNYLNDLEFARTFSQEKVRLKMIGPSLLRAELFKYHIKTILIDEVIDEVYKHNDIYSLITKHLEKKKAVKGELLENKQKKKLSDYLIRKGFTWGQINEVYADWNQI